MFYFLVVRLDMHGYDGYGTIRSRTAPVGEPLIVVRQLQLLNDRQSVLE